MVLLEYVILNFQQPRAPTLGKRLEECVLKTAFRTIKNAQPEMLLSILKLVEVN